jgi:hypothetical protein
MERGGDGSRTRWLGKAAQLTKTPAGVPGTRRSKRVVDTLFGTHSVPFRSILFRSARNVGWGETSPLSQLLLANDLDVVTGISSRYQSTLVYYVDMFLAARSGW